MQPLGARKLAAPSSSLLKFLRSQIQEPAFFTANHCKPRGSSARALRSAHGCTAAGTHPARPFSTTGPHAATLEASLLNLDFLGSALAPRAAPPSASKARPGIVVKHASQDYSMRARSASGQTHSWMRRLAEISAMSRGAKPHELQNLRLDDLPAPAAAFGDPTGTIFGRTKAATEPRLRCTEFDDHGNVVLVNGEFKKSELIAKYGLLPRDLRKIDSSLLPSIIVRPSSILINLLHLRLLVQHNRVLIFDAWGSSNTYAQSLFMYDLEGKLCSKEALPYEFRALEAVLISVTSGLESEYEGIREPVVRVLRELEEDIDRDKLRHLLVHSKKLGTFEQKARLVRDAIDSLLEEDEDLSAMYLTAGARGQKRDDGDHNEIEMLLESYHKVCDEIVQNSSNLVTNIRNTEEIVKAILDANRNALMLLDLKFSIGTLGIGSGAFIAGLYGMNLENFIEESNYGFFGVTSVSAVLAGVVCVYGMNKLRRVQKVRMWGEQGSGSRGNWREVDATAGLPGEKRADRIKRLKEHRAAGWR